MPLLGFGSPVGYSVLTGRAVPRPPVLDNELRTAKAAKQVAAEDARRQDAGDFQARAFAAAETAQREAQEEVAEAPWSGAEWAVALRFDNPRATVLVLVLGDTPLRVLGFQTP